MGGVGQFQQLRVIERRVVELGPHQVSERSAFILMTLKPSALASRMIVSGRG